jgi:hypothetical protein
MRLTAAASAMIAGGGAGWTDVARRQISAITSTGPG